MVLRGEVAPLAGGLHVPAARVTEAVAAVRAALADLHRANPLLEALAAADVRDRAGISEALFQAAIERLGDDVVAHGRTLRLATHRVRLDPEVDRAAERLLACLNRGRFAPPTADRLPAESGLDATAVRNAVTYLRDRGALREVAPGLLYPKATLDEGLRLLGAVAERRGNFEPVDAKAVLGDISRKWLIPLLEFYDRIGATRRDGNARLFTRRGETMVRDGIDGG
jgi:selenocysteine-specific elongation factor